MKIRIAFAAAAALALSACGSSEPEGPVENTDTSNLFYNEETVAPMTMNEVAPMPAEEVNATAPVVDTPAPEVPMDTQVQDDAEATGMTARVNRDEHANQSAPAE